jgi:uncharacterized protein
MFRPRQRKRLWLKCRRFVVHHVLHADDPPHRLALGVALGLFVTFSPAIGLQTFFLLLLAWLFNANKLVGMPFLYISNPVTTIPVYYPSYWIGRLMVGSEPVSWEWWQQLASPPESWWAATTFYWDRLMTIAWPLWVGSLIVGLFWGLIGYWCTYSIVRSYRLRLWGQTTRPSAA